MAKEDVMQQELARLSAAIGSGPTAELYMERGRLYNKGGVLDKALNDFLKAEQLAPGNEEAQSYIALLLEIFEYHYMDYYNP